MGNMSPNTRHEMIMGALQGAQAGAGSHPLTALLTPMASAAIGGRSGAALDTAREEANAKAIETIMAGRSGPMTAERLATLASFGGDELLAPGLQRVASTLMTNTLAPPPVPARSGGGGGRGSSGGTGGTDLSGLSGAMWGRVQNASGVLREAIQDLIDYEGLSPEEARAQVYANPDYRDAVALLNEHFKYEAPQAPPPPEPIPEAEPKRGWLSSVSSEDPSEEAGTVGSSVRKNEDVPPPPPGFTAGF